MDEHRLAELFRDAVRDAPPASFDERDVTAASRRATLRRRTTVAMGSAFGAAVLLGGTVFGVGMLDREPDGSGSVFSAQDGQPPGAEAVPPNNQNLDPRAQVPSRLPGGPPPDSIPEDPPKQGGGTSGSAGPGTGGTPQGCETADRELAVALAGELPAAAGRNPDTARGCPAGARGAAFVVRDGDALGVVSVILGPRDTQRAEGSFKRDNGTVGYTTYARSGSSLTVLSEPQEGSNQAPFAGAVQRLAQRIAEQF
ncbi:hypothetical protein GCM10012275_17590 [Longimycelium tulufanense]|uniref:Uncharacterized protein n=1 Tax=Longimycelium tulufanense TaxID=907463 RepID=A0A8J3C755_9PSEU|nr:hypothetical protein [Longimycelium tulufanense]GGM46995.1 hypothetical protein GCM10012275_17590 [Longimycelium tulufanense]